MKTLFVPTTDQPYPLYIGSKLLTNSSLIQQHVTQKQVMIFSNETVSPHYLQKVQDALYPLEADVFLLPDGEQYKNEKYWLSMINELISQQHHRDTTLIALGGGVIGDMVGFTAACYQRGVRYLQIPTSLLAQIDASIGGKTAINHPSGKNLIGAFYQPSAVIIDIDTLHTLPDREFNAGLAEMIKVALIHDAAFFDWLEKHLSSLQQREHDNLLYAIQRACQIKRDIVTADEKETRGIRVLLNLGHTFAHAIEHAEGYGTWLHGEAVAIGLCLAAKVSMHLNYLNPSDCERIENLLKRVPLPTSLPSGTDYGKLISSMMMDKKIMDQELNLILLKSIGSAFFERNISTTVLENALQG